MVTAIDTSVLLDVLLNDPQFSSSSIMALQKAANEGPPGAVLSIVSRSGGYCVSLRQMKSV